MEEDSGTDEGIGRWMDEEKDGRMKERICGRWKG
jgi:hypothetical protein